MHYEILENFKEGKQKIISPNEVTFRINLQFNLTILQTFQRTLCVI